MIATQPDCPASVTMLADHLDATLAAGEDLLALEMAPRADLDAADPARAPDTFDQFVRRLGQLEASLIAHLMLARRRAGELGRIDADIAALARLFRSGTEIVDEMIPELRPEQSAALGAPGDGHAYLRSRGLIAPEAAAPSPFERLVVADNFRIGGRVPIGQLLDMVSALLDLLDRRFGLYLDSEREDQARVAASARVEQIGEGAEPHPAGTSEPAAPRSLAEAIAQTRAGEEAGAAADRLAEAASETAATAGAKTGVAPHAAIDARESGA